MLAQNAETEHCMRWEEIKAKSKRYFSPVFQVIQIFKHLQNCDLCCMFLVIQAQFLTKLIRYYKQLYLNLYVQHL